MPMDKILKEKLAASIEGFRLPRYEALPDMGLYLEQTTKYINGLLEPLGCMEITGSMIRNYVKKGLIANPVKKQYYASHIAHLIAIAILKQVQSLENIQQLFALQHQRYTDQVAYDYLCMELENILYFQYGITAQIKDIGRSQSMQKRMLRSAITAVCHIIYLNSCYKLLEEKTAEE